LCELEATGHVEPPKGNVFSVAKEHGKQRYREGFALDAVVREYGLLRAMILELIKETHLALDIPTWRLIAERIDTGIAEAVRQYSAEREREQAAHQQFQQRLLGIVGHDLRSPLSAIMAGAAYLQARGDLLPAHVKTVQRITSSAQRIEGLATSLLDYARTQLGQGLPVMPRFTCLHDIGGRVLDEVQAAHPERQLRCDASGDTCGHWDPDRLMQAVQNLLENAIKYSPKDKTVTVTYRGTGAEVVLSVHNEGPPIQPELLPHIFKPFRQGTEGASTDRGSVGLGLYIVREVVEAHGGSIGVRSVEGEGTTFTVRLPRSPPS
jgi:signal transduction histidine kinase